MLMRYTHPVVAKVTELALAVYCTLMALVSTARPSLRPAYAGGRRAHALSFIEYALLAAMIILVAFVFKNQLSTLFSSMLDKVISLFGQKTAG